MRTLILSALAVGAAVAAIPASAQNYGYGQGYNQGYGQYGYDRGYGDRDYRGGSQILWRTRAAVDRAIQSGQLSGREREYFRRELGELYQLDARYRRDGYSGWESRDLDQRADRLLQRLRYARGNDWNDRDHRSGDDDRYDRNGDGRYDWRDQ